jgi:hypothetical protein
MDVYVFATPYRVGWDYYISAKEHTFEIKVWEEAAEMEYVCFLLRLTTLFLPKLQHIISHQGLVRLILLSLGMSRIEGD